MTGSMRNISPNITQQMEKMAKAIRADFDNILSGVFKEIIFVYRFLKNGVLACDPMVPEF